jgi:hypothetical protein
MRFLIPLVLFASLLAACNRGESGVVRLASESPLAPSVVAPTATLDFPPTSVPRSPASKAARTATQARAIAPAAAGGHTWYTSSAGNAKYYYCDLDDGWKTLSTKTLRQYSSEEELLAEWGTKRVKHANSMC